jgi:hypothetical protein
MMCDMPLTIQAVLRGDKQRRGWTYNQAGPLLDTTAQTVHRWTEVGDIPKRRYVPALAQFLAKPEQEIRDLLTDSERERSAAKDLQEQIDDMRHRLTRMETTGEQMAKDQAAIIQQLAELLRRYNG